MYVPAHFSVEDRERILDFIRREPFGILVSQVEGLPFATHVPFVPLSGGEPLVLGTHVARANPQWQDADGQSVLAVFSGPHAYVSPSWYKSENVVPTWNYVAVHAYGTFRAIHGRDALLDIVGRYVSYYEAGFESPWKFDPMSDYAKKLAGAIVGFRIEIDRLEGKWKLNQNQPRERREKVAAALDASDDANARAVAELMRLDSTT